MAALMRKYDPSVIANKLEKMNISDKDFRQLVMSKDPEGKGLSLTTCRKAKDGQNLKVQTICLICYAIGITPESTFVKLD